MSLTQEHLLDTARAQHHGRPTPPAPGTHTVRVMRGLRRWLTRRSRPGR